MPCYHYIFEQCHDCFIMTVQFIDLSATSMAAGDVNRALHSDDNITSFIYFNALDSDVGCIQQFLDYVY